jgi:diaminopimelate epimerase
VSRLLEFAKMHGLGNDFLVLDGLRESLPALAPLARRLADRRFGVGFDQMLVARPSSQADFCMEIYNADGSRAEMCANGIRAFFKYLRDRGLTDRDEIRVETLGGVVTPRWVGPDLVRVDMGTPVLAPAKIPTRLGDASSGGPVLDAPLDVDGERLEVSCVSMGNPHAVTYVEDVESAPVARLGPRIEHHPAFPNRVNVEFVQVLSRERLRQRTWERGAGETLACGSGACAVAVASILRGVADRHLTVELRGGALDLAWDGAGGSVFMTGPAAHVFTGRIELGEEEPCSKES